MNKLLQINVVVNTDSTGRIVEEIGQVAISNGWESYIAFGRNPRPSNSNKIRIGTDFSIKLHGLQTRLLDNHALDYSSKNATNKLIKQIELVNPDIIQFHNLHGYYINVEILFKYLAKKQIPVVWSLHDCWAFTGHCCHFDLVNCNKWKTICNHCPQYNLYPASWFLDNSTRNFLKKKQLFNSLSNLTLVSASAWLGEKIKESFLSDLDLKIIPNGVDLNTFYPRKNYEKIRMKYNLNNKFIILGVASIWSKAKGFNDFISLSKLLPSDCLIVLIGVNSNQISLLPTNIIGIKRTDSVEELAELYSTANVVVSLSYLEAFGLTPVEGFACGTPSIVYNKTAIPELVTPETGCIVEPGDLNRIIEAIDIVKSKNKEHYINICRSRAEMMYDKTKKYFDYIKLYNSLLSSKTNNSTFQ
jgi:glycosyltransferase involved in cell wall biosynthesis